MWLQDERHFDSLLSPMMSYCKSSALSKLAGIWKTTPSLLEVPSLKSMIMPANERSVRIGRGAPHDTDFSISQDYYKGRKASRSMSARVAMIGDEREEQSKSKRVGSLTKHDARMSA